MSISNIYILTCFRQLMRSSASENALVLQMQWFRLAETFPRWSTKVTTALHMYCFVFSTTLQITKHTNRNLIVSHEVACIGKCPSLFGLKVSGHWPVAKDRKLEPNGLAEGKPKPVSMASISHKGHWPRVGTRKVEDKWAWIEEAQYLYKWPAHQHLTVGSQLMRLKQWALHQSWPRKR